MVTRKKKRKIPEFRDNYISDHFLRKKKNKFRGEKKKKRPTPSYQLKKI